MLKYVIKKLFFIFLVMGAASRCNSPLSKGETAVAEPITCSSNQWLNGNTCESCPPGQKVKASKDGCEPICSRNEWVDKNACKPCPTGHTPKPDLSGCEPITCSSNQWLNGNTCESCLAGQKVNSTKNGCDPLCLSHEWLDKNVCKPCPAGHKPKSDLSGCEKSACPHSDELEINGSCIKAVVKNPGIKRYSIVTQYTSNLKVYADLTVENQKEYANKHSYDYTAWEGRISGNLFKDPSHHELVRQKGLYWQKIAAVKHELEKKDSSNRPLYDWVMWVDADILFTNHQIELEAIVQKYGNSGINFIISEDRSKADPRILINNGVFLLKNNP